MRRLTLLSTALLSLLFLAGAATAAEPTPAPAEKVALEAPAPLQATPAATPAIEADAALCQFVEAVKTNVLESAKAGYWCPPYTRYCQSNSQCAGYCGPGADHWATCEFGCCACAG